MLRLLGMTGMVILGLIALLVIGTAIIFITAFFYGLIKRLFPEEFEEKDEE